MMSIGREDSASSIIALKTLRCPVYISGETREAYISEHRQHSADEAGKRARALQGRTEEIESSQDFRVGEIDFHPFTIPHDAADNFGFTATHDGVCVATLMDFGHITTLITERLRVVRPSSSNRITAATCSRRATCIHGN